MKDNKIIADTIADVIARLLAGDRRALARLITRIENDGQASTGILAALYPHTGRAHIVGVTGAPGTGKSTLVNALAKAYRAQDTKVGIVAVDPTSPFSGGALLGDRIRMRDLSGDPGVFIRSMASRGNLGGLARATADVVKALDAAGYPVILVETVGAGQSEVEIARTAHTTLVVEAPGLGDDVQAIKAGVLEIADVLVVNKADREGAERTRRTLQMMLELDTSQRVRHHGQIMTIEGIAKSPAPQQGWQPLICSTVAVRDQGVDELLQAISQHRRYLQESGDWATRERVRAATELDHLLRNQLVAHVLQRIGSAKLEQAIDKIISRRLDAHTAVNELLAQAGLGSRE
jgi:LAO/AO transport system kinase